jgi:hypothetical protein
MIAGVHLEFLAQSSLRVSVFVQWVWTYVTGQRGSQIILNSRPSEQARRTQEGPGVGAGPQGRRDPRHRTDQLGRSVLNVR